MSEQKICSESRHEMVRCTCGRTIRQCNCRGSAKAVKLVAMGCLECRKEHPEIAPPEEKLPPMPLSTVMITNLVEKER